MTDKLDVDNLGASKTLWNSLEIAKIGVGMLTPLAVTSLGIFLSLSAEQRNETRTKSAENRAEQREIRAQKRDFDWRKEAEEREAKRTKQVQIDNLTAARQAGEIAAVRDDLIRTRSEIREDQIRRQQAALERENRIIERRSKLWDDIGPKVNDIYAYFARVGRWEIMTTDEIIDKKRNADQVFYTYLPFLTNEFRGSYERFMESAFSTFNGRSIRAQIKASPLGRGTQSDQDFDPAYSDGDNRAAVVAAYADLLRTMSESLGVKDGNPVGLNR